MGYYWVKKSTELLIHKTAWKNLKNIYIVEENENVIILCITSDSLPPSEL